MRNGELLLSLTLKHALKRTGGDFTFYLKNIIINGSKRGCNGFIKNNSNGTFVYVNTERCAYGGLKNYMYRYADNEKDYTGYSNRWADTLPELVSAIEKMLASSPAAEQDFRF